MKDKATRHAIDRREAKNIYNLLKLENTRNVNKKVIMQKSVFNKPEIGYNKHMNFQINF